MKKIIAILLSILLVISLSAVAYAEHIIMYEDRFVLEYKPIDDYIYEELYHNYDDNGNVIWVLVYASSGPPNPVETDVRVGDVVIHSNNLYPDFNTGYGVYDVEKDKFIDLYDIDITDKKYDNLTTTLKTSREARLIGDSDNDGKITILDATAIQRHLAKIELLKDDVYSTFGKSNSMGYYSDLDNDNKVSIIDATAIQCKLAQLELGDIKKPAVISMYSESEKVTAPPQSCTQIDYEIVSSSNYYTSFDSMDECALIIRSVEQYEKLVPNYRYAKFDKEFFETKSLVISIRMAHCHEASFDIYYLGVDDNTLYLKAREYTNANPISPSCPEYRCYAAVDKELVSNVDTIVFF